MGAQLFLLRALSLLLVALAQVGETSRPSAVRLGRGRAVGARASALAMPKRQPPSARRSRAAGSAKRCRAYEHEVEDAAEVAGRTPWRRPRLGSWAGSEHKDVLECVFLAVPVLPLTCTGATCLQENVRPQESTKGFGGESSWAEISSPLELGVPDPCAPPECAKVEKEETVEGAKNPAQSGTPADTIPDEAITFLSPQPTPAAPSSGMVSAGVPFRAG